MEVIVHFSKSKEQQLELKKRVATIHAQTVLECIRRQACPTAQKLELLKAVEDCCRKK